MDYSILNIEGLYDNILGPWPVPESMPPTTVEETLNHLSYRGGVLKLISQGVSDKRKLTERTSKSRPSINRDIRLLKQDGFIQEEDGVTLTNFGKLALESYLQVKDIAAASPLIPHLPSHASKVLKGAEIQEMKGTRPIRPLEGTVRQIQEAESVKVIFPVLFRPLLESVIKGGTDGAMKAEVILTETVVEEMFSNNSELIEELTSSDDAKFLSTNESISYGMAVIDGKKAVLCVFDDDLRPIGTVKNDQECAINWAKDHYSRVRGEATDVFLRNTTDLSLKQRARSEI